MPPRRARRARIAVMAAATLLLLAAMLPVDATATWLARDGVSTDVLRTGILVLKAMLALHAALILWLAHVPPRAETEHVIAAHPAGAGTSGRAGRGALWAGILAAVLVAAAVLRGIGLEGGLWHDEIATLVRYTRRPIAEIVSVYDSQNQHPLYSLLAHGSFAIFGESAWALRLPAAIFGVASLAATYWFARLLVRPVEAMLTTALLAASYHHVWFSQNARGYTILLFLTLAGTGIFLKLLTGRAGHGWRWPATYGAVMAAAAYTHLSAVFVVLAHGAVAVALAVQARRHEGVAGATRAEQKTAALARWLPAFAAVLLAGTLSLQLYALVLPQLATTLFGVESPVPATVWRSPLWLAAETLRGLGRGVPGGWLALAAGALVAGAGALSFARRTPLAFALMALPPVVVAAVMVALQHNLWPRLFFFAAAFAVMIVVRGVYALAETASSRHGRTLAAAALSVVIAGSAATVPRAWGPKQDFGGALAYVERERDAADAVVALGLSDFALLEYLRADWSAPRTADELRRIEETHPRTWAVYTFPTHLAALYPDVGERLGAYRVSAEFPGTVGGGTVYVMVNR